MPSAPRRDRRPKTKARPPPNSEIAARSCKTPGTGAPAGIQAIGVWILPQPWYTNAAPITRRISKRAASTDFEDTRVAKHFLIMGETSFVVTQLEQAVLLE